MNVILFMCYNLVACDFPSFHSLEVLKSYAIFSFNILSLKITVVSAKTLKKWELFK